MTYHPGEEPADGARTGWRVKVAATEPDEIAPDGSEVRVLARLERASMARFRLQPDTVSEPVRHKTIEEYWYVASGTGQMWLNDGTEETLVYLQPGVSLALRPGTRFQFRASGDTPLDIVGVAVPGWPGDDEAVATDGFWPTS
jgi:mannose-6-phosphate isomerase-like protein (cupin superfamily)